MSNKMYRILGFGALALGLASIVVFPASARDRSNGSSGAPTVERTAGGDRAMSRMSDRGLSNSNGIFMPNRVTGRDRADIRMNPQQLGSGNNGRHSGRDAVTPAGWTSNGGGRDAKQFKSSVKSAK
jgi:hypothetical protein